MSVTAKIIAALQASQIGTNDFGGVGFNPSPIRQEINLTPGVGVNQADLLYVDERQVASGATDAIDVAGVLAAALGGTIAMAELVAMLIINAPRSGAPNTTNLTIGAGTNPLVGWLGGTTPTLGPIRPGGMLLRAESDVAGICVVTPGTGDLLNIVNSAGAIATYQIALIGRSA